MFRKTLLLVAVLALAATGTATAAKLITSKDIKNESILGKDIKRGTVKSSDIGNGSVGLVDLSAAAKAGMKGADGKNGTNGTNGVNGKDGTNGTNGKDGARGPSDAYYSRTAGIQAASSVNALSQEMGELDLPAGAYTFVAKFVMNNINAGTPACVLAGELGTDPLYDVIDTVDGITYGAGDEVVITLVGAYTVADDDIEVSVQCQPESGDFLEVRDFSLVATQVGTLH